MAEPERQQLQLIVWLRLDTFDFGQRRIEFVAAAALRAFFEILLRHQRRHFFRPELLRPVD